MTEDLIFAAMRDAETKAWEGLRGYKFWMFGYHAARWVNYNQLLPNSRRFRNPFKSLVEIADRKIGGVSPAVPNRKHYDRLASFTHLISVGLFHDWQPDRLFMIWTAYLDETDTHGAPVMALGGFVAPARAWKTFDKDWAGLLAAHGLEYSHATDMLARKGQYRGWTDAQHNQFIHGAHEVMNGNLRSGAGFVAVMRVDDYNDRYKTLPKPRKPPEDTMYGVLLRACVSFSLAVAIYQKHGKTKGQTVNFVVENGGVNPEYARQLYGRFKNDRFGDKDVIAMLGPMIGFAEKKESPGCQAADLMLLGAIRQERTEHGAAHSDIMASSFADATKSVNMQDVPTFRIPTNPEVLLSLRENMFAEEALRRMWAEAALARSRPTPSL